MNDSTPTVHDWEKIKKKALHSVPYGRGELVTKYPQMAHIITLEAMLNGTPSRKAINDALDKTLEDADEAILNWDIRNAPLLILACRKYSNYIVPKSLNLDYELECFMQDNENCDWAFTITDRPVDAMILVQRQSMLENNNKV